MAKAAQSGGKNYTQQSYEARRDWLIDTAETPKDKANLKKNLKELDDLYKTQQRSQAGISGKGGKNVKPLYK